MFSKKLSNKSYSFQGKYKSIKGGTERKKIQSYIHTLFLIFPVYKIKCVGIYHLDTNNVATNATFIKAFAFNSI